jgi:hypothetical protein
MGMLIQLLLTKFLPVRFAWIVGAFVFARALAARRQRMGPSPTLATPGNTENTAERQRYPWPR